MYKNKGQGNGKGTGKAKVREGKGQQRGSTNKIPVIPAKILQVIIRHKKGRGN